MLRPFTSLLFLIAMTGNPAMAQTKEPFALRDIGSFHLGGRNVDLNGKPVREVTIGGDRNKVASIRATPVMIVYGDNAKDHPRWSKIRQGGVDYAGVLKAAGGSIDVVDLPDAGIKGNSHMVMMDKNSGQVADLIQKWLVGKGLVE